MLKKISFLLLQLFLAILISSNACAFDKVFFNDSIPASAIESKAVFNEDYPDNLLFLIDHAKESIYMSQYSFSCETKTAGKISAALIAAAGRGVKIVIFLNGGSTGVGPRNREAKKKLEGAGIAVTINEGSRVAHSKLVVVDSLWTLSGSTNLTETSMIKNNEANLLIHSSGISKTLVDYIRALPAKASGDINMESKAGEKIQAVTDRNFIPNALELIKNAKKEICITTYLFDHDMKNKDSNSARLFQQLIAAHKRGVKIRAFIEQSTISFNEHIHAANMRTTAALIKEGITGIRFDSPSSITHCKILIADGYKAILGSTNLHGADIDRAHQVNFMITEMSVIADLCAYFEKLYATGVTYKDAYHGKKE